MSSNEIIEKLVVEYEKLNQTASAVSFYLRAAEYGFETHPLIAYASLLRVSICIEDQKDRNLSVSNVILQAIAFLPARPEGYFLMSRFHERYGNWQECYAYACTGLLFAYESLTPLPARVDYLGDYCFIFEKAVSCWWIGRKDESLQLLNELNVREDIASAYKQAVLKNLENF
jgi:hypothetical protein